MKFIANREELLKALLITSKISPSKSIDMSTTYIKIDLNERGLFFTSTDGKLSIISKVPFIIDNTQIIRDIVYGSTLINAQLFTEIVKRIDGKELSFELIDDSIVKIENEKSDFKLNAIDPNEFHDIDFSFDGVKITLLTKNFIEAINQVSFAVSLNTKDTRQSLGGVNIESVPSKLVFTATDGARLAKKEIYLELDEKINATISAKTLQEVIRTITTENSIDIYINERRALFVLNNTLINASLINESYPSTKNIIPKNFYYTLTVNSNELISAMERVSLFSTERENVIKLTMTNEYVEVSSKSLQVGSAVERIKSFDFNGERLEISFNSEFVKSAIKSLDVEEVTINFLGEMKPFTVVNKDDDSVIQLITPVRTY